MTRILTLCAFFGLAICGCNSNSTLEQYGLSKFGLLYHEFHAANDHGPVDLADLKSFKPPAFSGVGPEEDESLNRIYESIDNGDIVVVWNAKLFDDGEKNGQYVLAYKKDVPTQGGLMLDAGGFSSKVSAAEFTQMEKIPQAQ